MNYAGSTNSLTQVVVAGKVQFNAVGGVGGGLVLSGSGGVPNGTYYVLGTTNIGLPLDQMPRLLTNQFDENGNFNFTNPMDTTLQQSFYLLQLP